MIADVDRPNDLAPTAAQRLWMYETMVKSRHLEDRMVEIYMQGKAPVFSIGAGELSGELHTSQGQEPVAVGVCANLGPDDCVTATHRPHHVAIARGVDLKRMSAEIFGKETGLSSGRGGHMHLYDRTTSFSCSGIIAEGLGPAAGMAFARKRRGLRGVAVAFIGEGAANQGAFHEVMNLVGIYRLPFVCIVEDNGWAVTVPKSASTSVARNSDRASAYGLAGAYVEGNDPDVIFSAAARAIERARAGGGGTILEVQTTRLRGHFIPDTQGYRGAEVGGLVDMIPVYRERLIADGVAAAELDGREARALADADEALTFARSSPPPQTAIATQGVFA